MDRFGGSRNDDRFPGIMLSLYQLCDPSLLNLHPSMRLGLRGVWQPTSDSSESELLPGLRQAPLDPEHNPGALGVRNPLSRCLWACLSLTLSTFLANGRCHAVLSTAVTSPTKTCGHVCMQILRRSSGLWTTWYEETALTAAITLTDPSDRP